MPTTETEICQQATEKRERNITSACFREMVIRASAHFKKPTEQGYAPARVDLDSCFDLGIGTGKNDVRAVKLYQKIVDQEYVPSFSSQNQPIESRII